MPKTNLKILIKNFNFDKSTKTDFKPFLSYLTGEKEADLSRLSSNEVGSYSAIKTLWKLKQPKKPRARSRVWESPRGYRFLVQWTNLTLLRILIRKVTRTLPRGEYRLKNQLNDASRSSVSTLEEGWKRPTTKEYLDFLGFSQGSLEEIKGDIDRMLQDGFIKSIPKNKLSGLGIDLKSWNEWSKNPINSSKILSYPLKDNKENYRTLKEIKGENITYEMLIELINKTDYLLRKLVESLEKKLDSEHKGYQVEQARIRGKLKNK